jgi:hypothetical protein
MPRICPAEALPAPSNAEEGHLAIFDRTPGKPWEEKLFRREERLRGRSFTVRGM